MKTVILTLDRLSRGIARLTAALCGVMLFVMLGLLAAQVVMRYFFGAPPSWTEETAISLFAWVVLLYGTVGVREGFHVAVDFLPDTASPRLRRLSDRLVMVLIFSFGLLLCYAGQAYVVRTGGQRSAALQFPIEALHLAAPVCGVLLLLHSLALFFSPQKRLR